MLPDLDTAADAGISADNLRAVQVIYFAWQLEEIRAFQVADRIAQHFQQGLLPIGAGQAGAALQRYLSVNKDRLSAPERQGLYARVLGVPGGHAEGIEPNTEFLSLWLQFVCAVSAFARQHEVDALLRSHHPAHAAVQRAALALAANASVYGAHYFAARQIAADVKAMLALLDEPEIKQAFGARDMWGVIDQVNRDELGGAVNLVRHRTQAQAGSVLLQWLAAHADALRNPAVQTREKSPSDADLLQAVAQWLAVSGLHDDAVEAIAKPLDLPAMAQHLLQALGLVADGNPNPAKVWPASAHGQAALFCGAPGTGKTLAAHVLAQALSRDVLRVNLEQVIGKYIGETEKNLDRLLAEAQQANAILLIDEADALFTKRSEVGDAHDRFANVDIDYLLQRMQAYSGLVIIESTSPPPPADAGAQAAWRKRVHPVVNFPRPRP